MNLVAWLEHIERLHDREIELGLGRIRPVAARLGVTDLPGTVVTVAGTNGKGSTVALMESLALSQGQGVACYTSPHIHRFNERIRVNGQAADDDALVVAFERVEQARGDVPLTYFEFTTLVALDCFRRAATDLVLLEVGLGGRLDAVNLVDADVAVVTSIGLDHMAWLGNTREAIAREKCGIARRGRPLLYGELSRPDTVDSCCREQGAELLAAGEVFGIEGGTLYWQEDGKTRHCAVVDVPLGHDNLATAVQALSLAGMTLPGCESVARVGAATHLAGRCQSVMVQGTEWLFDVGHNAEAISRLVGKLPPHAGRTLVVLGMLGDKPASDTLALLAPLAVEWHLLSLPPPRGVSAAFLAGLLDDGASPVHCHADADALCQALKQSAGPGDRVLVLGSFLTVDAVARGMGLDLFRLAGADAGIVTPERTQ